MDEMFEKITDKYYDIVDYIADDMSVKLKVVIGIGGALLIGMVLFFMIFNPNTSKSAEESLADYYLENFTQGNWKKLYDCLLFDESQQYLTKDIFVDQMKYCYPYEGVYDRSIDNIQWSKEDDIDEMAIDYLVKYTQNGEEKEIEFKIISDSENFYVSPESFITRDITIEIPKNTDIIINNEKVWDQYLIEDTVEKEVYQIDMFNGKYSIAVKNDYTEPYVEDIFVGVLNSDGEIVNNFKVDEFSLSESEQTTLDNFIVTYVQEMFKGLINENEFGLYIGYYDENIKDKIDEKRENLKTILNERGIKYLNYDLIEVTDTIVSSNGVAVSTVNVKVSDYDDRLNDDVSIQEIWKVTTKKYDDDWMILDVEF